MRSPLWCLAFVAVLTAGARAAQAPKIDATIDYFSAIGGDAYSASGNPRVHDVRLDWHVREPVVGKLHLDWRHVNSDKTMGRAYTSSGIPFYIGSSREIENDFGLVSSISNRASLEVGYFWKSKACCPADGDRLNPRPGAYRGPFIGGTLSIGRMTALESVLAYTWQAIDVRNKIIQKHELTVEAPSSRGPSPFATLEESADYFSNSLQPYHYTGVSFGVIDRVTSRMRVKAFVHNVMQHLEAYPFPGTNAIHYCAFVIQTNYTL